MLTPHPIKRAVNRYEGEVPGVTYAVIKKWMLEREHGDPYGGEFKEQSFKFNADGHSEPAPVDMSSHREREGQDVLDDSIDVVASEDHKKDTLKTTSSKLEEEDYKHGHPKSLRMVVGEFAYNNGFMATTNEYPDLDTGTIYSFMEEFENYRSKLQSFGNNGIDEPEAKKSRLSLDSSTRTQLGEYPDLYSRVMTSLENLMKSNIHLSPKLAKTMATDTIRSHCPQLLPESGGNLILDDDWAREVLEILHNKQQDIVASRHCREDNDVVGINIYLRPLMFYLFIKNCILGGLIS